MPVLTYDGVLVDPDGNEAPSLRDIALAMSRMPRFAGHTRRWYSVLDHSLFVAQMAIEEADLKAHEVLALLLHDAHEALTGDVPTHFKPNELRALQKKLDRIIVKAHYGNQQELWDAQSPLIKQYDQRALAAEAMVIGAPRWGTMPRALFIEQAGSLPREEDMVSLRHYLYVGVLSNPQMLIHNEEAPNVKRLVWRILELQGKAESFLHPMAQPDARCVTDATGDCVSPVECMHGPGVEP